MEKGVINHPPWSVSIHALIELHAIERLCALGQNALDSELSELDEAMDKDCKIFKSENEEGDYLADVNDEYIDVSETLPCLYWYSQFLIAFSFFERTLDALCMSIQKQDNLPLSFKDISGQGIFRAKTYMTKVCNIKKPFELLEWQMASFYSEIRNSIAHRNGYIDYLPEDKRSLYYRLNEIDVRLKRNIEDQEDAQIILTRDFTLESINRYFIIIKEIGGLGPEFITPKHGIPLGERKK